jgi:hypothetical protein
MIFGAGDQNKRLSSAAGRPKDTSHRKENANTYSAKISSSKSSAAKTVGESKTTVRKSNSDKLRGSYEGLQHSSSTVLQMNGVGYDNKSLQNARYNKNQISHNNHRFNFNMSPIDKNYSIMDNYSSMSATGSSSNKISNIVKNNMMFK